jgi:hypothetical protein
VNPTAIRTPSRAELTGTRSASMILALLVVSVLLGGFTASPAAAGARRTAPSGPTSVLSYGAKSDGTGDSTAAFLKAQQAALASAYRFANGPTGSPQAVVYVPPGTYRLLRLPFRSNIRMEVSAAAVLEQAGGRHVDLTKGAPALIVWDGPAGSPLTNVTLIGVASSAGGLKQLAKPLFPGWSVDPDFTFNLDPAATDASVLVTGIQASNVTGFLIQNVYSIENDFQPAVRPSTDDGWWPQSRKAALGLRERSDTPANGSVYYDPHNGTIENWYNVHGPKGFGPNQVNAGHNLSFRHIFSRGGTAMRFETDASQGKAFASEVRDVTAVDVAGQDCNRAVSFAPHAQNNYNVHITGVQSVGCGQGVMESVDETNTLPPGAFFGSTIGDVTVTAGMNAQLGLPGTDGLWTIGQSGRGFSKDTPDTALWSVVYTAGTYSCSGIFSSESDLIMTTAGRLTAVCT